MLKILINSSIEEFLKLYSFNSVEINCWSGVVISNYFLSNKIFWLFTWKINFGNIRIINHNDNFNWYAYTDRGHYNNIKGEDI